jgi:hypothetical protein
VTEDALLSCTAIHSAEEWSAFEDTYSEHYADHGLELPSSLEELARSRQVLRSILQRVLRVLRDHKVEACLAFGTLLGKVREGDVMAHDHDGDVLVSSADIEVILGLHASFKELGLALSVLTGQLSPTGELEEFVDGGAGGGDGDDSHASQSPRVVNQLKVYDYNEWKTGRQGWCFVDLLCWETVGGHIRVRDDHCHLVPLPLSLLLPLRNTSFLGEECMEPADPQGWLEFQYGDDWETPSKTMGWLSTGGSLWFQHE